MAGVLWLDPPMNNCVSKSLLEPVFQFLQTPHVQNLTVHKSAYRALHLLRALALCASHTYKNNYTSVVSLSLWHSVAIFIALSRRFGDNATESASSPESPTTLCSTDRPLVGVAACWRCPSVACW